MPSMLIQRIRRLAGALYFILLLSGCASSWQTDKLRSEPPAALPPLHELTQTPFYPQQQYQCGPAALATVLNHYAVGATPDDLVSQVYVPGREGSLQIEMVAAARQHELEPVSIQ